MISGTERGRSDCRVFFARTASIVGMGSTALAYVAILVRS